MSLPTAELQLSASPFKPTFVSICTSSSPSAKRLGTARNSLPLACRSSHRGAKSGKYDGYHRETGAPDKLPRVVPCPEVRLSHYGISGRAECLRAPSADLRRSNPDAQNLFAQTVEAQTLDTQNRSSVSSSEATAGSGITTDSTESVASDVSFKNLPMHILRDQKALWLFPVSLAQGKHCVPTIAIVGATAVLIVTDKHVMPYFRRTSAFDGFSDVFSGTSTGAVEVGVPAAFMLVGLLHHDSYATQTALLAGEAYLDSAIPHVVIKLLSRRLRPESVPPSEDFSNTFFRSHVSPLGKGSSFPSGHAAGAFSIATVIAQRYKSHRLGAVCRLRFGWSHQFLQSSGSGPLPIGRFSGGRARVHHHAVRRFPHQSVECGLRANR